MRITLKLPRLAGRSCQFENQVSTPRPEFCDTIPVSNPAQMLTPQTTPSTTGSTNSPSVPGVNVTCILTGMPTPLQDYRRISIHKGLNFITVCLILTTSLIGTSLLNQQFWIEGNTLAPGVNVLNGPAYLSNAPLHLQTLAIESTRQKELTLPFNALYNRSPFTMNSFFKKLPVILQKDLQTLGNFTFQSYKHQIISQVFQPVLALNHHRLGTRQKLKIKK